MREIGGEIAKSEELTRILEKIIDEYKNNDKKKVKIEEYVDLNKDLPRNIRRGAMSQNPPFFCRDRRLDGPKKQEINISFWSVIFVLKTYGYSICNRYDLGPPGTSVPTNEIETFAFGYRPNKD